MQNIIYGKRYKLAKRCGIAFLILAHLVLVTPLPELEAMESANYKIKESSVSSGGGKEASVNVKIDYLSLGESAVGNIESQNYKISLGYINTISSKPPVLTGLIPDSTMRVMWDKGSSKEAAFDLDDYFSSPDNSILTYNVEGNAQIVVDIDSVPHTVSFSQPADFSGIEKVRFVAIDENGNRTKSNFVILIVKSPSNNPPVIYPINDITGRENGLIEVTPTVFDPDGDILTTSFTAPLDDNGQWQTTFEDAGTYTATATVSDGALNDSESFNIEVRNVNRPPYIEDLPDITVAEGDLVKLNITAYDPDGDSVTISYPEPFNTDGTWQTSYSDNGTYQLTVTASDGALETTEDFTLFITNKNGPPDVRISSNKSNVSPDEEFTVYVFAEDPDGDTLKLTLTKDGSVISDCDGIILEGPTFSKTFSITEAGNHTIEAVVEEVDPQGTPPDIPPNSYDSNTKFLSHFDGPEGSTSIADESVGIHVVTAFGNAHLDSTNKKFGASSLSLDGNGDYVSIPDSDDWAFGTHDFTVDFWIKFNSIWENALGVIGHTSGNYDGWMLALHQTGMMFIAGDGSSTTEYFQSTSAFEAERWYHIALVRDSDSFTFYLDGETQGTVDLTGVTISNATGGLEIGRGFETMSGQWSGASYYSYVSGYMDEIRISKGIARWTNEFDIPDHAYEPNIWYYSDSLVINVEESFSPDECFPLSGDFNGDGLTDLGYYNRALGIWKIALSNNGVFGVFEYWIDGADDFGKNNDYFYPLTSDFNGDGRTDVGYIRVPTSDGALSYIDIATSNAEGFDIYESSDRDHWRDSDTGGLESNWKFTTFSGDFNGDGLTDIGQIHVDDSSNLNILLARENLGDQSTRLLLHADSNFVDASGRHTVTATGAVTSTDLYVFGTHSVYFDGTNDYLSAADHTDWTLGANDFTIDWRMYWTGESADGLFQHTSGTKDGWSINTADTGLSIKLGNGSTVNEYYLGTTTWSHTTWYHVAIVRTGGYLNLYVNGTLEESTADSTTISNATGALEIGRSSGLSSGVWTSSLYMAGYMDEVRISNTARWTSDFTPPICPYTYTYPEWDNGSNSDPLSDFSPLAGDFNGDGLSDLCLFKKNVGRWVVMLSHGDKFGDTTDWLTSFGADEDPILGDFNTDGLTDIGYVYTQGGQWYIKYATSDGTAFNKIEEAYPTNISGSIEGTFITGDSNGDGLFDVAVFNKDSREWTVRLHQSKYPDLLVEIDNGIGGKTKIEYKDSVMFDNTGYDNIPDLPFSVRVVTEVTQEDGLGNNYKTRYFYENGFFEPGKREFRGFGHVRVIDVEGSVKETNFNQDNIFKGRPKEEIIKDKYERIYSETVYNWQSSKLHGDLVDFPYLADKTSKIFNPNTGESKSSQVLYTYDGYGNVTIISEEGFLDVTGDERETSIIYYYDTTKWILAKPLQNEIKDSQGTIVSAAKYTYDSNSSLIKEEKWLGQIGTTPQWGTSQNPSTEFTYDDTGNVISVKDARESITQTTYDSTKTFPESVTNILGHTQRFTYNKATGKILTSTDPNSQRTTSAYDGFGRLINVKGPGSISEVSYEYVLSAFPAKVATTTKVNETESVTAYSFIDGLGRQILSRIQAEYQGASRHIVSGEVEYDSRGQVIKKYLPYYIGVPQPEDKYLPPSKSTPFMAYKYDAMGRLVETIRPDNKANYVIYNLNEIESINENGQRMRQTKDVYGRIIEIEEANGSVTNYVYDTLGNLTDTYDSASPRNHAHIEYDTLGRKISMDDPDMGNWVYGYDDVGNLVSQTDAKGQVIDFDYDAINRLTTKSLRAAEGGEAISSVQYTYDQNQNGIGRLSRVDDSSGATEFFYDILGREITTTKTINGSSYTIERTYDSLDRLITVTYPDTTVIKYEYNTQGGIDKIGTVPAGDCPYFVSSVDYNANGQIEEIHYGNSTSTTYNYDPYNFRLSELKTYDLQLTTIQDLSYNFDPIGNVTSILDSAHTNTQHFQYDNINRLIEANGASYGYIDYQYDSIGNMLKKGDLTLTYGERGHGPHAVTTSLRGGGAAEAISYDANGNMIQKGSDSFEYDIENRLVKVTAQKGGGRFDVSINFTTGWNFFSLPGFVPNTGGSIAEILSSIEGKYEQVSKYDTATSEWLHYVRNGKFNQFDTLEQSEGYLIYITESCTLDITGLFPIAQQTKELKLGWNLINAPTNSEIDVNEALEGITYDGIAEYDGSGYTYNPETLKKGKAYWIHVNFDQTWSILLSEVETTYTYDGDGGRVLRQTNDEATLYIGSSFEATGTPGQPADKVTKHIFMGSTRVCSVETEDEIDHIYYYHQDHIGSSNVITDETGAVINILEYTPYGLISRNTGNYSTDKRFTGKIYDKSSALYYYGARYYDPELGRFISADPTIQRPYDPQDFNRYSYCRNNPVRYIDPTGLSWWSAFWNFVAGFFGAVVTVIVTAVTGGNIALGMAAGGAVAGAILGGVSGGWGGALKGAAIGFGIGLAVGTGVGVFGPAFGTAVALGGAAYAGTTGGLEGLGDFAAGAVGAFAGYQTGQAIASGLNLGPAQTNETRVSPESKEAINEAVGTGDFEQVKTAVEQGTGKPAGLSGNDVAKVIANGAKNGTLGRGNNPDLASLNKPDPSPSQSELFWRGSFDDANEIGITTERYGGIINKIGKALTVILPKGFKRIGRGIAGGGAIDIKVGQTLQFIGKWGKSQFPEPYW
ncbi:MAG: hypothetical protein ISS92_04045 [Candidatus Omnitrophica bacterium]|nr:hypothetical protein [Candidatus Omnitrophota bacterium]